MAATKKPRTSRVAHKKATANTKKSRRTTSGSNYTNVENNGIIVFAILSALFFIIAVIRYL